MHWREWSDEVLREAASRDVPIFLSIGYSSCHWCHVMAHESFDDPEIAEVMNKRYVCVKVDREERPDLDDTYMAAVQLTSGRGGWPLSAFLVPNGRAFFAGTYFPPRSFGNRLGFLELLHRIGKLWLDQRDDLVANANELHAAIRRFGDTMVPTRLTVDPVEDASSLLGALGEEFDPLAGGFGAAPKFPPHSALRFLRKVASDDRFDAAERTRATEMRTATIRAMLSGAIHDWVGGGIHRYSTDAVWHLPHFEKMLYDNLLFLAEIEEGKDSPLAARRLRGWLDREMRTTAGLFASARDADTPEGEGFYYSWTWEELSPYEAEFRSQWGAKPHGNYEDEASGHPTGRNLLFASPEVAERWTDTLDALLVRRNQRTAPALDDKALVGLNGLAIVTHGAEFADRLLALLPDLSNLPRALYATEARGEGFFEDYAGLLFGLTSLGARYEAPARAVAAAMRDRFWDADLGGFFSHPDGESEFLSRSKPAFDSPVPSANALAAEALVRLGEDDWAEHSLLAMHGFVRRAPTSTEALATAALSFAGRLTWIRVQESGDDVRITSPFARVELAAGAPNRGSDHQAIQVRLCTATRCFLSEEILVPNSKHVADVAEEDRP